MTTALEHLIAELANRDAERTEADVQAGIRQLLLTAPLNLDDAKVKVSLEVQAGERRRIDIEAGATVIEVKKDLRVGNVALDAVEHQLKSYVEAKEKKLGGRYVGVLTDGADWRCYHLQKGQLVEVSRRLVETSRPDVDMLLSWLEGVLATTRDIKPVPEAIRRGLGAGGSAHALDRAALMALYGEHEARPEVQTKRQLWAKLLTTALGTQFEDSDELFVEHTLLVCSAGIIAHAVLGFEVGELPVATLLSGARIEESAIFGVVEADFFDWLLHVPGGEVLLRTLARRLARFDWRAVEHDVLKVLYESIIGAETRKKLGEYYTPDWLAQKLVEEVVTDPLGSKVLDPACGSGTFLFHAVRRYLAAAEAGGIPTREALDRLTGHVMGLDLHPVAVTLARVTYLLAIGQERLSCEERGALHIPVYLGDSMQWGQWKQSRSESLWSHRSLIVSAEDRRETVPTELKFPRTLLRDFRHFDGLVKELSQKASGRSRGSKVPSLAGVFQRHSIAPEDQPMLAATFAQLCRLHDERRDHIWGYYIRNLAHPQWLALDENQVDLLLGNPPWLAYRYMPGDMQKSFQSMSEARRLWHGAKVAPHQDLSALFVARTVQLYLKKGGRFAFVMPSAALDRGQYKGFRGASFDGPEETLRVTFGRPWDLRRLRPHFFPISSSVVFGRRTETAGPMPADAERWSGTLPTGKEHVSWEDVAPRLQRAKTPAAALGEGSPYKARFRNGATVFPRLFFIVERLKAGPLGQAAGRAKIRSLRSANEKAPWKDLPPLEGVVESEFLRPIYLGETLLPYRLLKPPVALIPWDKIGPLPKDSKEERTGDTVERLDHYPGLASWWQEAERLWEKHRSSERLSLLRRLDYHKSLAMQFDIPVRRVLYNASGMHLAAAWTTDPRGVVEHKLYWATAALEEEALYLCAVLNAAVTTELVRPLMSYGKDERDIDKHLWKLPIPLFNEKNPQHVELSALARKVEAEVAGLQLPDGKHFSAARRQIREFLDTSEIGKQVEAKVRVLLGSPGPRRRERR